MAATNFTPISLYYSTTASAVPSAGNLVNGELALNITDGKLYFKNNSGVVTLLAGAGGAGIAGGSNTQVQYNSSGNLAGSANFVFDGTNLGIGTSSPSYKLEVYDATNPRFSLNTGASGNSELRFSTPSSGYQGLITYSAASNFMAFYTGATERMRIDSSGNVGIGTSSPALPLTVQSGAATQIRCRSTTTRYRTSWGIDTSGNTTIDSYDDTGTVYTPIVINGNPLKFNISGTTQMLLDSSGNLGLGVTPSAWSGAKAIQLNSNLGIYGAGTAEFGAVSNTYYNGTNWIYGASAVAARYAISAGQHQWYNAPSGTAGNAITFTQAMTLDASGRLGIGTSSPTEKLQVDNGASNSYVRIVGQNSNFYIGQDGTGAALVSDRNAPMYFSTNNTERMRIDSSGNVGIGTTPSGTYKLQVSGTGGFSGVVTGTYTTGSTGASNNQFYANPASGGAYFNANRASSATGELGFGLYTAGSITWLMYVPTSGTNLQWYNGSSSAMTLDTSGNLSVINTVSDTSGNVRSIPQNAQTSAYVLVAGDNGKHISITTGGVTVPASVFSAGQVVTIFNNSGSNQTITQGTSVTLRQAGTANTGNRTLAQYGVATVLCVASNTFVISGAGLS